jgi:hypothetical protein
MGLLERIGIRRKEEPEPTLRQISAQEQEEFWAGTRILREGANIKEYDDHLDFYLRNWALERTVLDWKIELYYIKDDNTRKTIEEPLREWLDKLNSQLEQFVANGGEARKWDLNRRVRRDMLRTILDGWTRPGGPPVCYYIEETFKRAYESAGFGEGEHLRSLLRRAFLEIAEQIDPFLAPSDYTYHPVQANDLYA